MPAYPLAGNLDEVFVEDGVVDQVLRNPSSQERVAFGELVYLPVLDTSPSSIAEVVGYVADEGHYLVRRVDEPFHVEDKPFEAFDEVSLSEKFRQ